MTTRTRKAVEAVDEVPFESPSVEVILPRKVKSVWHILTCRTMQVRPDRSGVRIDDERRLASASSSVQAAKDAQMQAKKQAAMAVLPPDSESSMFTAMCPKHGAIRRNSTVEYALESAYWHAREKH